MKLKKSIFGEMMRNMERKGGQKRWRAKERERGGEKNV